MRDDPDRPQPSLSRKPTVILRVEPAGPAGSHLGTVVLLPGDGILAGVYMVADKWCEMIRAFLEKTDPQGPDTLIELLRASLHYLRPGARNLLQETGPQEPDNLGETVGNAEMTLQVTHKLVKVLGLTASIVPRIIYERIKSVNGSH